MSGFSFHCVKKDSKDSSYNCRLALSFFSFLNFCLAVMQLCCLDTHCLGQQCLGGLTLHSYVISLSLPGNCLCSEVYLILIDPFLPFLFEFTFTLSLLFHPFTPQPLFMTVVNETFYDNSQQSHSLLLNQYQIKVIYFSHPYFM